MFADWFSSEERPNIDEKEFEALNKAAKTLLNGLRGTGTTYAYDAHGRIAESRERNFAFEKTTTILYNAHGDKIEERTEITNNSVIPVGVAFSINENGGFVPEQPGDRELPPAGVLSSASEIRYSYQYDSHGNWEERAVNYGPDLDKPFSVDRRKLIYY
jgi:hypothetical protein